jgi:hypothetical protein
MDSLIKADIFFFVATFAVAIVAVCAGVVTFYVVKILKDVKHISQTLSNESEKVAEDIDAVRAAIKEKGNRIGTMIQTASKVWKHRRSRADK